MKALRPILFLLLSPFLLPLSTAYPETKIRLEYFNTQIESSQAMFVKAYDDPNLDILFINGRVLDVHNDLQPSPTVSVLLDDDVSSIDVGDLDGDGQAEVIAFRNHEVIAYSLDPSAANRSPQVLFQLPTPPLLKHGVVSPQVILMTYDDRKAVVVPGTIGLQLFDITGTLLAEFPLKPAELPGATIGNAFDVWRVHPPQSAPSKALEFRVRNYESSVPDVPEGFPGVASPSRILGQSGALRAHQANLDTPGEWPWFALHPREKTEHTRIYYAFEGARRRSTLVSQKPIASGDNVAGMETLSYSPARRYPGLLVDPKPEPPDFNGDGYADLFLWNARLPGRSFGELAKASAKMTWPISLTIHLYSPPEHLYEALPRWRVKTSAPISRILFSEGGSPLFPLSMRDLNNDGLTDAIYADEPNTLSLWMPELEGRDSSPHRLKLDSELLSIGQSVADIGNGQSALLLRVRKGYVIALIEPIARR